MTDTQAANRDAARGRAARQRTGQHNTKAATEGRQQTAPDSTAEASAKAAEYWFAASNAHRRGDSEAAAKHEATAAKWRETERSRERHGQ